MIRPVFWATLMLIQLMPIASSAAASGAADQGHAGQASDVLDRKKEMAEGFDQNAQCFNKWEQLLSEWRANGGGIKDSLLATRQQIASDKVSKFAQLVRRIWISQDLSHPALDIGAWPADNEEIRRATKGPNFTVDNMLPNGCESFAYLYPLIWEELVQRKDEKVTVRKLRETPVDMEWESHSAPRWLTYWLLVRLK
jgi:hypothetical protein